MKTSAHTGETAARQNPTDRCTQGPWPRPARALAAARVKQQQCEDAISQQAHSSHSSAWDSMSVNKGLSGTSYINQPVRHVFSETEPRCTSTRPADRPPCGVPWRPAQEQVLDVWLPRLRRPTQSHRAQYPGPSLLVIC